MTVLATAVAWPAVTPPVVPQGGPPAATGIAHRLDQYGRGDHDGAIQATLRSATNIEAVRRAIEREAPAWIDEDGAVDAPMRRSVVAAFTIEFARGVYAVLQRRAGLAQFQNPGPADEVVGTWGQLRSLVEWACELLRKARRPGPVEREWFLASVQLLRDFWDSDVKPIEGSGHQMEYGRAPGHLGHARARFPDEPWFKVMVAERQTDKLAESVRVRRPISEAEFNEIEWLRTNKKAPPSVGKDRSVYYTYLSDLRRTRQDLLPLASEPSVRARVHLNLGAIALSFDQRDLARRYLDDIVQWTSNPCMVSLAHFLRGRVDDDDGRLADAERSYRASLAVMPRAQTASTALGAALWLTGRPVEATAVIEAALALPVADDPWTAWQNGGHCTEWYGFIHSLREGLRR